MLDMGTVMMGHSWRWSPREKNTVVFIFLGRRLYVEMKNFGSIQEAPLSNWKCESKTWIYFLEVSQLMFRMSMILSVMISPQIMVQNKGCSILSYWSSAVLWISWNPAQCLGAFQDNTWKWFGVPSNVASGA